MLNELWSDLRVRTRSLFRRAALEQELDEELRFHLEREIEKYERMGMPHNEARRRARLAFGGVERAKEESRDARGTIMLETMLQDLRYALRGLRAKPAFTLGVVVTLGLGIGANAAMFGIVDRLLFRTPAYLRDAEHVHRVYLTWVSNKKDRTERQTQFPRYLDFVRWTHAFSSVAAFHTWRSAVGDGQAARERYVTAASASYLDFFDARPALGRFFAANDDSVPAGAPVVVLGYAYWQSEFAGRSDVLGKRLRVGHTLCTIIGVAPEHFTGMADQGMPSLFVPISTFAWDLREHDYSREYTWSWLELIVRRKPGTSMAIRRLRRSGRGSCRRRPVQRHRFRRRATATGDWHPYRVRRAARARHAPGRARGASARRCWHRRRQRDCALGGEMGGNAALSRVARRSSRVRSRCRRARQRGTGRNRDSGVCCITRRPERRATRGLIPQSCGISDIGTILSHARD